ncbi:MAG: serine/threonine-protein kinase [Planctomycetota bacterium]
MAPRKLRFLPTKATFQLGDKLGSGTVGVVYRATSDDIQEPVALKLLHPSVSGDEKIVDRFEREIQIMERLNHPHIVRHYGGGMLDGQYFYAMQLLEHGSLKDRLANGGPLPWPLAAAYGVQIASALQHAHNHGIVHRDLKPSNLFFDERGDLVLGDFGIARDTFGADITAQGMTVGTYAYMSPEQITADTHISGKADLYSLGCVMFEMLTGRAPFQGANFAQVWEQHMRKEPPTVSSLGNDCPDWLEELIAQLLAKSPEERPFSARAVEGLLLQHLLDEFGEEAARELTSANRPGRTPQLSGDREKPRMWVILVTLVAIAVVLAVSAFSRG